MNQAAALTDDMIEKLLALPTQEARTAFLHAADLNHACGLSQVLACATKLIGQNPTKARQLAALCHDLASQTDAPALVPQATYLLAQTHAVQGEFDEALRLIRSARWAYTTLGEAQEALRCNVGLMTVLNHLGRYQEALDAGRAVLEALAGPTSAEIDQLVALVQQNLGVTYEYMGRYEEALNLYQAAEDRYRALGMTEHLGHINNNRGVILLNLGRGSEALAAFERAAAIFATAGLTHLQAEALVNIGNAQLLLGRFTHSLAVFEQARSLFEAQEMLVCQHILLLDTAEAYLALNLYPEALAAYREAESALQMAGMAHDHARALRGLGSTLIAVGRFREAEQVLAEAVRLFAAADNVPFLCSVMLEQAALFAAHGDGEAALTTARQALRLVAEKDWPVQHVYAHLRLADLYLPDLKAAEAHLQQAQQLAAPLALPQLRYRLNQRLGHIRRLQGRRAEAQTLLQAAMADVERVRSTLTQETIRRSFLRDKTALYDDLVALHLADDDPARAFEITERAKSRALVDLLTGKLDFRPPDQAKAGLAERLQQLQADLNAVYNHLLGPEAKAMSSRSDQSGLPQTDLRERAIELEQEISHLHLQLGATLALADSFAAPLSFEAIQEQIPADTTLLTYYLFADEIIAFIHARGRLHVTRRLSTPAEVARLLERLSWQWDRFRAGRAFVHQHMARLERSTQRLLAALYAALIGPLEELLAESEEASGQGLPGEGSPGKLVIVPHGLLHQVPFQALFDERCYLLERFEISYAPSATVFVLCQARTAAHAGAGLVMGVPDPLIPAVAAEVEAVSRHIPEPDVYLGEQATLATLRAKAPGSRLLHLACHGLFRADNPMFSALKLHDGWLTAADILSLDLEGTLVTLSACESGRSQVIGGDELIGLARAFLGAGATALAVSLWLVHDEATAMMMSTWYEHLRQGRSRAAALRAAQLALKMRYPHPYYWAPFMLLGQR